MGNNLNGVFMDFITKRSIKSSLEILLGIALECTYLGGPLTLQLYNLVRDERYLDVIRFSFDYTWAFSCDDFVYARQIQALFSKSDFIDLGVDKEKVAFDKFVQTEDLCRETNQKFENLASFDYDTSAVLYLASQKIAKILGTVPSLADLDFSFGPGANTSVKSAEACARTKLSAQLECSTNLIPLVGQLLEELPMLCSVHDESTHLGSFKVNIKLTSGKLSFVPKTSLEDRAIVVEPILNSVLQMGLGKYMARQLLRVGLDLRDQTLNQRYALKGSEDGSLATIDLSSASDCVSRGLVWSLLPFGWASILDCARSESVSYNGDTILLEKFSSMGNGFTFPLESLIFYSVAWACCKVKHVSVEEVRAYGDDIIVPSSVFDFTCRVLRDIGFLPNLKKSFGDGPFRESCGADYFNGFDIRPCYVKEQIADRTLFSIHNWFIRHCELKLAAAVLRYVHQPNLLFGPDGYGDGHLIGDFTLRTSRAYQRAGYCGGVFDTYTLKQRSYKKRLPGDYVFPVYSIYQKGDASFTEDVDPYVVRGTNGYTKISIYTLQTSMFAD